ncbi:hypothetical protein EG329_001819 [Mollisiaceae sp. DMI_Dod_QoI]|nr:hypothetical protein EG329_001819 [Helotiales sp. DMI_Dod_QoI]
MRIRIVVPIWQRLLSITPGRDEYEDGIWLTQARITSHLIKQVLPLISEIDAGNVEEFKELDAPLLVGYFDADDTKSLQVFLEIAESPLHDAFLFGTATDEPLFQVEKTKKPFIVLWNPLDEVPAIYDGDFEVESITSFAQESVSSPLIPQFGMQKFAEYAQTGFPLALIFALTQTERTALSQTFKPIAKQNKGKMNFATVDVKKLPFLAEPLGLDGKRWPAFVVHDIEIDETFVFDQWKEIEAMAVERFLEEFWKRGKGESETAKETGMKASDHDEL